MTWTKDDSGAYHQDLGGVEKTYRFLSTAFRPTGREHWGLYAQCTLEPQSSLTEAALCQAWKALRFEYPALVYVPDGLKEAVHPLPTPEGVEEWCQQTFQVETTRSLDEILAEYPICDLPLLIYLPATSQVIILISHWRCDALGCCLMMNRLLELVSNPPALDSLSWEIDPDSLPPIMEDAAGAPHETSPAIEETTRQVTTNYMQKAMRSLGLPYKGDNTVPPAHPARQSLIFTEDSSRQFIEACQSRKISVSAAVYAGLAEAMFALASDQNATEYSTLMAVNMRSYLPEPCHKAAGPYVSTIIPTVARDASFKDNTESLTQHFKTWYGKDYSQALRQIYKRSVEALLASARAGPPPKPPNGITVSSLGVIDRVIATPGVKDFSFGVSMLTRQMLLYVWTFRGQVQLSVNYNDAYYDESAPREILQRIQGTLERELALELQAV